MGQIWPANPKEAAYRQITEVNWPQAKLFLPFKPNRKLFQPKKRYQELNP